MDCLLSIITINLNNGDGLRRTLQSIADQQCPQVECIVIDGGSTDHSLQVISNFQSIVTKTISELDGGIYAAMNKGWRLSGGKYCLFLNAGDDFFQTDVLNTLLKKLAHSSADYLYGNLNTINVKGISHLQEFNEPVSLNYLFRWFIPHPASCIKKSLLQQYNGYAERYRIIADWIFSIKAFCHGARFEHIPYCIANFYLDGISSTQHGLAAVEKQMAFQNELAWLRHDWEWYHTVRPLELSRPVKWLHRFIRMAKKNG